MSDLTFADAVAKYIRAKDAYYNSVPIMTDAEFDALEEGIRGVAPDHPVLKQVGIKVKSGTKVALPFPLLSTQKAMTKPELTGWADRLCKVLKSGENTFFVGTEKLDGVSCLLTYVEGVLVQATTRGDGLVGQDITAKARSIVPPVLVSESLQIPPVVYVRGELVISFENFEKWNKLLESQGEEVAANPRNAVSGLISADNTLDTQKLSLVSLVAYELRGFDCIPFNQQLTNLQTLGFETPEYTWSVGPFFLSKDAAEWDKSRAASKYPLDGVVYRVDAEEDFQEQGVTSHHFKAAIAYKFPAMEAITTIRGVEWSLGTKEISPVLLVDPVLLDGAVVRRVSGHNIRNLIGIEGFPGSTIKVVRSGSVIPLALHRDAQVTPESLGDSGA